MKIILLISFLVSTCLACFEYDVVLVNPTDQARAIVNPATATYPAQLSEFTVCFWINPNDDITKFPFTFNTGDNLLQLAISVNSTDIDLVLLGAQFFGTGSFVKPNQWNHICYGWSNVDGNITVHIDGAEVLGFAAQAVGEIIPTDNPSVLLGQSFQVGEGPPIFSVNGRISQFHFWSKRLDSFEVTQAFECFQLAVGDIINWYNATWTIQTDGSIQETTLPCYLNAIPLDELPFDLSKLQKIAIAYLESTDFNGKITAKDPVVAIGDLLVELEVLEFQPDVNTTITDLGMDVFFELLMKFA